MKGNYNEIREGDALQQLKEIDDDSIDLIVTDPPYGYSFMNKDWDKAVVSVEVWRECLRVLKVGAFAFVMSAPRQDVLSRMIVNLQDAGFRTDFTSIYYSYASGFPKASNTKVALSKRYAKTSESQMREMWSTIIQTSESVEHDNNGGNMSELLEDLEQGKQYKVYAYTASESKSRQIPERQRQSSMEGRDMLQKKTGQLCYCQICKMPVGIYFNGKKGWICHGTQADNGAVTWQSIDEEGMCSSYQSQPIRQSFRELDVICNECITQKIRDSNLSGSYLGLQPKPAVEVVLTVMKPLSEKSFVDQALNNGKGITWLDDCRIPFRDDKDKKYWVQANSFKENWRDYGEQNGYDRIVNPDPTYNKSTRETPEKGRFPANLLCSDDALNDGKITKNHKRSNVGTYLKGVNDGSGSIYGSYSGRTRRDDPLDSGSYSRYFDLDSWYNNRAQFIITPKASPSERNKGLDDLEKQKGGVCMRQYISETIFIRKNEPNKLEIAEYLKYWRQKKGLSQSEIDRLMGWNTMYSWMEGRKSGITLTSPEAWIKLKKILNFDDKFDKQMTELIEVKRGGFEPSKPRENNHPTVKPLKLMSYLITMGSRENDIVLDPFCGSGTTLIAAEQLHRKWIGIELNTEYAAIARKRIEPYLIQQKLL